MAVGLVSRVFANGLEDQGLIPGQVIPKTQKMVLDAILLNTQRYKTWNNTRELCGSLQGGTSLPRLD